ncbi:MAG: DUF898 domain-containing protein [Lachnospiraceae bacterium]|nr:DUF898 domain-containing protein [Lachnospiraceae bacterium]
MGAVAKKTEKSIAKSYLDIDIKEGYIMYAELILISVFSAGILFPFAYYKLTQRLSEHTLIDGRKIVFVGRLRGVYGVFILGLLSLAFVIGLEYVLKILITGKLAVRLAHMIIAGLTSLVFTTIIRTGLWRWRMENTHFADSDCKESVLLLDVVRSVEISIIKWFITFVTLTIAYPYIYYLMADYYTNRTQIDKEQLLFTGKRREIFKIYFINLLFSIITLGVLLPRQLFLMKEWTVRNIHLNDTEGVKGRRPTWFEVMFDEKVDKLMNIIKDKFDSFRDRINKNK